MAVEIDIQPRGWRRGGIGEVAAGERTAEVSLPIVHRQLASLQPCAQVLPALELSPASERHRRLEELAAWEIRVSLLNGPYSPACGLHRFIEQTAHDADEQQVGKCDRLVAQRKRFVSELRPHCGEYCPLSAVVSRSARRLGLNRQKCRALFLARLLPR